MQKDNQLPERERGWKVLLKHSKPYHTKLVTVLVLAVVGAIFILVGPKQIEHITNIILAGMKTSIDLELVKKIGITLMVIYGIGFFVNYLKRFLMADITQNLNDDLRNRISEKINRLPLSYFDKVSYGDVLSRITNDVDTIGRTLNQSLPTIISAVTLIIGSLVMMLTSNVTLTLSAVGVTLVGFAIVKFITRKSQPYFNKQQDEIGNMNGYVEESFTGHNVIKAYNASQQVDSEFGSINEQLYEYSWKANFLSGLMTPLMSFIGNVSYVVICLVGALLVMKGRIEFGVIVAFTIYIRQFNNPLSQLTQVITELQTARAAADRISEFLTEPEIVSEDVSLSLPEKVHGDIEFENIKFGYVPERMIIHDFSSKAKSGEKIAVVGPTGAGKSTLINLLMRFYELNAGTIKIDGIPIDKVSRADLREQFGMVLQDTWIFEGSILENVAYNRKDVTEEQIIAACEKVGIDHFVRTLPEGYHTILNDSAALSEGQMQQLTIARAIVKDAPLLILDEATSSVDTRTEQIIQKAMDDLMDGRTSFVIAHRLSTIRNSDLILVMKDGNIIESGTHDELMDKGDFYFDLYNSQFSQG